METIVINEIRSCIIKNGAYPNQIIVKTEETPLDFMSVRLRFGPGDDDYRKFDVELAGIDTKSGLAVYNTSVSPFSPVTEGSSI